MTPKFLDLLVALHRHGVEHVVVGGVAAILEGAPMTTIDLDIVYRVDEENLLRLNRALMELQARYRDPAGRTIAPTPERLRTNRVNLLQTELGFLDAMQAIASGWDYDDVLQRSHVLSVDGLEVCVLDLASVIASKEFADRDKDRAVLALLRRTLEVKRERDG